VESTSGDEAAVARAACDYIEGWFDGDSARMERALHPELAKRSLEQDASGAESVRTLTAREMIDMTASGEGQREDVDDRRIEVEVHDVSEAIASATVRSALYVDLLQLLKTRDGWRLSTWRGATASRAQLRRLKRATVPVEAEGIEPAVDRRLQWFRRRAVLGSGLPTIATTRERARRWSHGYRSQLTTSEREA
jgi:Putative lumazine-binding